MFTTQKSYSIASICFNIPQALSECPLYREMPSMDEGLLKSDLQLFSFLFLMDELEDLLLLQLPLPNPLVPWTLT